MDLRVTSAIALSPSSPATGQAVLAQYTLRNYGSQTAYLRLVGVGGRGPNGEGDIEDYPWIENVSVPPNGDNRGHYSNPQVDRLLEKGQTAMDIAERKRIYGDVQRILAKDLPYIPLWWWKNLIVKTPSLKDFVPYPDGDLNALKKASFRSPASSQ